jgi:sugar porter (SP) family MFS transporter
MSSQSLIGAKYHTTRVWGIGITASLGSFIFGYNLGVFTTCQDNVAAALEWGKYTEYYIALFAAMLPFGAIFGALMVGHLASQYGRLYILRITSLLAIIGAILTAFPNSASFGVGRFLSGVTSGCFATLVPVYISEMTPHTVSGRVGSLVQVQITLGIAAGYLLGLPLPNENYEMYSMNNWWMAMFLFQILPLLLLISILYTKYSYDTPYWLWDNRKFDEAKEVLRYIYTDSGFDEAVETISHHEEPHNYHPAYPEDEDAIKVPPNISTKDLLFTRKYFKMIRVGILLNISQQWTGANAIIFFCTSIFKEIGGSLFMAKIYTCGAGIVNVLACLVVLPFIDRLGRRPPLILGQAVIAVILVLMGLYAGPWKSAGVVPPVILTFLFLVAFEFSLGPIVWLYCGEIMIDKAMSLATGVNLISVFLVVLLFPLITTSLGMQYTFWLYSIVAFLGFIWTCFDVPETKGCSRRQISRIFVKNESS